MQTWVEINVKELGFRSAQQLSKDRGWKNIPSKHSQHLARLAFFEQKPSLACLQKYTSLFRPTFVTLHRFCLHRDRFISRNSILVAHIQLMTFTTLNPFCT